MIQKILNLIKYILEYLSLRKCSFTISKNINFGSVKANIFFLKSLNKSKSYFEMGSGNSTVLAKYLNKKFLSVETSKVFFNFIKSKKLKVIYCDIGPTKYFSYPILPNFLIKKNIINYANSIKFFFKKFNKTPELILIDGRFRVFCTLTILEVLKKEKSFNKTTIIIDDYINRKNYHNLKKVAKITTKGRFGVINFNKNNILNHKLISRLKAKYIKIAT